MEVRQHVFFVPSWCTVFTLIVLFLFMSPQHSLATKIYDDSVHLNEDSNSEDITELTGGKSSGLILDRPFPNGFTNTGAINLSRTGGDMLPLCGIQLNSSGKLINKGDISVATSTNNKSYNYAYGICNWDTSETNNSGEISATATSTGNTAGADVINTRAYGINRGRDNSKTTNSGEISATATSTGNTASRGVDTSACGIESVFNNNELTNSGKISATTVSTGNTSVGIIGTRAYGIDAGENSTINNSGTIAATVHDENNTGYATVLAYGIDAGENSTINNSGTIAATVHAEKNDRVEPLAYGIYYVSGGSLHSSGLISAQVYIDRVAKPTNAKQVYVKNGKLTVTGYAMKFEGTQADLNKTYADTIGVGDGASVIFDNATLYVYRDSSAQATYTLPDLVEGDGISSFTTIKSAQPDVTATLDSKASKQTVNIKYTPHSPSASAASTSSSTLTKPAQSTQAISFAYAPKTSVTALALEASMETQRVVQGVVQSAVSSAAQSAFSSGLMNSGQSNPADMGINASITTMVASNDDTILPKDATIGQNNFLFMRPAYGYSTRKDNGYGYTANTYGTVAGYTRKAEKDLLLGIHGGYVFTDVNYLGDGYSDRKEDIHTGYAGLHVIGLPHKDWLLSGTSTFFYSRHDYEDANPKFHESADYNSYALRTELSGQYIYHTGNITLLPELALSHVWNHTESHTTKATAAMNTTFDTVDDHELFGSARLHCLYSRTLENGWQVTPSVSVGITQLLTDGQINSLMSLGGISQQVVTESDYTTFSPSVKLRLDKGAMQFAISYTGGFSDKAQNTQFAFQAGMRF